MRFSLETLQAGRGDSLIVHYGDPPRFIVIDGGPASTYAPVLRPRLDALKQRWQDADTEKLLIDLLLISHIDDDHVGGVIRLLNDLQTAEEKGNPLPYLVETIWHNSFDDLLGRGAEALHSRLASTADAIVAGGQAGALDVLSAGVITSVTQGREVRRLARQLGIPLNSGFESLILAAQDEPKILQLMEGLTLRVLGPTERRLRALHREWEKVVRKLHERDEADLAAFVDRSVSNLSSIIVLLEANVGAQTKRMLLTGDARGDDLLKMIQEYGLARNDSLHVDIFKVPHHGSDRNSAPELFQAVTADHYVISANGEHGNPDPPVIRWILEARAGKEFKIHLTNSTMVDPKSGKDIASEVRDVLGASSADPSTIVWPAAGQPSFLIDLGSQPVDY